MQASSNNTRVDTFAVLTQKCGVRCHARIDEGDATMVQPHMQCLSCRIAQGNNAFLVALAEYSQALPVECEGPQIQTA